MKRLHRQIYGILRISIYFVAQPQTLNTQERWYKIKFLISTLVSSHLMTDLTIASLSDLDDCSHMETEHMKKMQIEEGSEEDCDDEEPASQKGAQYS